MKNIELTITREDYENSSKDFSDIYNCPLATAVKRITGLTDVLVGPSAINRRENGTWDRIYNLKERFRNEEFNNLKEGIEFTTQLIPV